MSAVFATAVCAFLVGSAVVMGLAGNAIARALVRDWWDPVVWMLAGFYVMVLGGLTALGAIMVKALGEMLA